MRDFGLDILNEDSDISLANQHNILSLAPKKEIRQYNVSHKYFSGTNLSDTKRLDYTISVEFIGENQDNYEWRVHKNNLFFNQKEPSLLVEEVTVYFVNALYPINITTKFNGEISSIANHDEIVNRWSATKKKLLKEYRGELVLKLMKKFEKLVQNPLQLELSLSKEIFWSVFFTKRYQKYGATFKKTSLLSFPLEAYQTPLSYKGVFKLTPNKSIKNPLKLNFQGSTIIPSSSKWNTNSEKEKLTSDLEIEYILDKNSKIPLAIKAFCDVFNETKKEDITQIETLIIRDESRKPMSNIEVIVEEAENTTKNKSPKKKKKWYSFGTK